MDRRIGRVIYLLVAILKALATLIDETLEGLHLRYADVNGTATVAEKKMVSV